MSRAILEDNLPGRTFFSFEARALAESFCTSFTLIFNRAFFNILDGLRTLATHFPCFDLFQ